MDSSRLLSWNPAQPRYFFGALVFAFCFWEFFVWEFCTRASVSLFSIFLRCFFFILLIFAVFLICETQGQCSDKTQVYTSKLYRFPRIAKPSFGAYIYIYDRGVTYHLHNLSFAFVLCSTLQVFLPPFPLLLQNQEIQTEMKDDSVMGCTHGGTAPAHLFLSGFFLFKLQRILFDQQLFLLGLHLLFPRCAKLFVSHHWREP